MFSFNSPISRWQHIFLSCIVIFSMTALVACGGGGGGSSSGTDNDEDSENTVPTATITSPLDGDAYTYGDTITFTGSGADTEDGELSGASLAWTSDLDDTVGTGTSFTLDDLSLGDHTITLTATDSDAATGGDTITVSVKAWTHPADLSDNISSDERDFGCPRVAMDSNGNAVIVWYGSGGSSGANQVFMSEYRDGEWTHPSGLTDTLSYDGSSATAPRVAMDDNGNAIVTWYQKDETSYSSGYSQIFKSEYRDGQWTKPSSLTDNISPDNQNAYYPRVAMDNNGNAIITWQQQYDTSGDYQIFKSEYRDGAWTDPSSLTDNISPNGSDAKYPQVAMDDNGNAIITWYQKDSSGIYQIYMSEYRDEKWTDPGLTDNISKDGNGANDPQVAMDNNGNAIITWFQNDSYRTQIYMSEYRDGGWTHPSSLSNHINPDGDSSNYPQVAMDDNGNAIITWFEQDGSYERIFKSEYRDGAWTHPSITDYINPDGTSADNEPQVAMDNNGNAVIIWYQPDDSGVDQLFKSEYRNGQWSHPTDLSDNISPDGQNVDIYPQVAMSDNGNAIITWGQSNGTYCQVFKSEYY